MATEDGKAAIVTGGSRGIGRAIVERLARDGARVVFAYYGDAGAAADVERAVAESGGHAYGVKADVGDSAAVESLLEEAHEHLGGLDILVNNAAIGGGTPLAETTREAFDRTMAVNVTAVFLTMRYAAQHMSDGGRIVNISTRNTVRAAAGIALYAASKGAVEQFTAVAARELGSRGITVNTVSPGATDTDMLRASNSEEALRMGVALTALGRLGRPDDIAAAVAFLVGPDGRWLTGQNIHADGGMY